MALVLVHKPVLSACRGIVLLYVGQGLVLLYYARVCLVLVLVSVCCLSGTTRSGRNSGVRVSESELSLAEGNN